MDKKPLARALVIAIALLAAAPSFAAVTPELQRQVRASTFEVVMKKPAEGSVTYDRCRWSCCLMSNAPTPTDPSAPRSRSVRTRM